MVDPDVMTDTAKGHAECNTARVIGQRIRPSSVKSIAILIKCRVVEAEKGTLHDIDAQARIVIKMRRNEIVVTALLNHKPLGIGAVGGCNVNPGFVAA